VDVEIEFDRDVDIRSSPETDSDLRPDTLIEVKRSECLVSCQSIPTAFSTV
jgi:hypothetical protein